VGGRRRARRTGNELLDAVGVQELSHVLSPVLRSCHMRTAGLSVNPQRTAGYAVKGLAHPGHWAGPLGPFFERSGAVKAGPLTALRLLKCVTD